MDPHPTASADDDPLWRVTAPLLRQLYAVLGVTSALAAVLAAVFLRQHQPEAGSLAAGGYGVLALLCGLGWRSTPLRARELLGPVLLGGLALLVGVSVSSAWGLQTPGLVLSSLAVLLVNLAGTPRQGAAAALAMTAAVATLALGEQHGWAGLLALPGAPPLPARLLMHLAAVGAGALLGQALARIVQQQLRLAHAREQRFRALLGMATCGYWECAADGRLTHWSRQDAEGSFSALPVVHGRPLWDAGLLQGDTDTAVRMQALLRQGQALVDVPVQWQHADGSLRPGLLSGQPRQGLADPAHGHWGVVRDVSTEQQARQALLRSEALLTQVVALAPDIITLTDLDTGRYVMVNDSFCRLLGHERAQVLGRSSADLALWRDPADRARLVAAIARDGLAQDQLITFNSRQGQAVPLLISGVRFVSEGQTYLLLNGRDQTEANRLQQEREAVLANASVGIAFTRQRRFVLANARFEAMYGWPPRQ